jgi:diaminopimelate epimerase
MIEPTRAALAADHLALRHRTVNGVSLGALEFALMHGNGNLILVVDEALSALPSERIDGRLARAVCRSFRSVRVDGVAFVRTTGDRLRMTYFESDGTRSRMCGNALRCVTRYGVNQGYLHAGSDTAPAQADPAHAAPVQMRSGHVGSADAGLAHAGRADVDVGLCAGVGAPGAEDLAGDFVATDDGDKWVSAVGGRVRVAVGPGREFRQVAADRYFVFTGLAHLVLLVDDLAAVDVVGVGRPLRYDRALSARLGHPEGLHVDFMQRVGDAIGVRTYEVGVEDETDACGTGVAASAAVAHRVWGLPYPVRVRVRRGEMTVGHGRHGLTISGDLGVLYATRAASGDVAATSTIPP